MTTETEDELAKERHFSCAFCGPGTWATWEVVTDDGVVFACDRHHVEMSEAKMIRLERMMGKKTWKKIHDGREIVYEEEFSDFESMNDYE